MSRSSLPLDLAVALNATLLIGAPYGCGARVERVEDERAAENSGLFHLEPVLPADDQVRILVEIDDGQASEIEGVHWPAIGWTDAVTMLRVEGDVLGWRRHPFRRELPSVDYSGWTREKLAAEMKRRFGDVADAESDRGLTERAVGPVEHDRRSSCGFR